MVGRSVERFVDQSGSFKVTKGCRIYIQSRGVPSSTRAASAFGGMPNAAKLREENSAITFERRCTGAGGFFSD
jgi:hypothetical protein